MKKFFLWAGLFSALLFAGCVPPRGAISPGPEQAEIAAALEMAKEARLAGNYLLAEKRYLQLLQDKGPLLTPGQKIRVRKRLAASAVHNSHFQLAEDNLRAWKKLEPGTEKTWEWQSLFLQIQKETKGTEILLSLVQELILRSDIPFALKVKAALFASRTLVEKQRFSEAPELLKTVYFLADSDEKRRQTGEFLSRFLSEQDLDSLSRLEQTCPVDQPGKFPCPLFSWHLVKKQLQTGELGELQARVRLNTIYKSLDPALQEALAPEFKALTGEPGPAAIQTALLLPLSGSYSQIGWKIAKGADVAQWELLRQGIRLKVRIINTADPEWKTELAALPGDCVLVGGPLRPSTWQEIYESGLHRDLTFFTFRSALNPGQEGIDGYRFFPSRQDQIRPLIEVLSREMDVHQYGIIYPKSDYGRKMARAFTREVRRQQGEITALTGYGSANDPDYRGLLADFLRIPAQYPALNPGEADEEQDCQLPLKPSPDFQAVFIPDGFSTARRIIPEFFFFDEYRMFFLGPTLWSQQIDTVTADLDSNYYKLALVPKAWWSENPAPAVTKLKHGLDSSAQGDPDFWKALGYDFTRFSQRLVHSLFQNNADLPTALQSLSGFSWSMAPLQWDSRGKARQELFVFQLSGGKLAPVSLSRLKQRRDQMHKEYEYVLFNYLQNRGCFPEEEKGKQRRNEQPDNTQMEP
ncbi:MAG: penicillin-binding protein activator [Desulfohalobiaceae bacterium]|nr:penicillin-binding protein activator [Desulfohalobiaceae bacterium]